MHWNSPSQLQTLQAPATRLSSPLPNPGHYISPSASWGLLSCWWHWILPLPRETFPPQTGSGAHSSWAELPRRIKDAALINDFAQLLITASLLCGLHSLLKRKCQAPRADPALGSRALPRELQLGSALFWNWSILASCISGSQVSCFSERNKCQCLLFLCRAPGIHSLPASSSEGLPMHFITLEENSAVFWALSLFQFNSFWCSWY